METMTREAETYNGWKNYETWNVALWIQNDEGLYSLAREIIGSSGDFPYARLASAIRDTGMIETPDGVAWNDSGLDLDALDEMLRELGA